MVDILHQISLKWYKTKIGVCGGPLVVFIIKRNDVPMNKTHLLPTVVVKYTEELPPCRHDRKKVD